MIHLGRKVSRGAGFAAVAFHDDGIDVVQLVGGEQGRPRLALATSVVCAPGPADRARALAGVVTERGLRGTPCVCILSPEVCAIRLVDAPAVPDEELTDAVRWSLQEAVEFPVDDAALVVLARTAAPGPDRTGRVVVVLARRDTVRDAAQVARQAGLDPRAVCAPESALAALAPTPEDPKGTAFLRLAPKQGMLVIGRAARLFVSRVIPLDADAFTALPIDGSAPLEEAQTALESLSLEVQRSVDFFDAGFGRIPVGTLWLIPGEADADALAPALQQNLGIPVRAFDVNEHFACDPPLALALQARFATALGAASLGLRGETPADLLASVTVARPSGVNALSTARACLAIVATLVAVSGVERFALARATTARLAAEQEQSEWGRRMAELSARSVAKADPALAARLASLHAERDAREAELRALSSDGPVNAPRFVALMEALARHPIDGAWLNEIRIDDAGAALGLRGSSLAPDGVSRMLDALAGDAALAGVRLGALHLSRAPDDPSRVLFELREHESEDAR